VRQGKTLEQVAEHIGLAPITVRRRMTSKDIDFLETVKRCLNLDASITLSSGGYGHCHRIQMSSSETSFAAASMETVRS
jgi:hypothetical protein